MTLINVRVGDALLTVEDLGEREYQVGVTSPDGVRYATRRKTPEEAIAAGEQWLLDAGHPLVMAMLGAMARAELHR